MKVPGWTYAIALPGMLVWIRRHKLRAGSSSGAAGGVESVPRAGLDSERGAVVANSAPPGPSGHGGRVLQLRRAEMLTPVIGS